MREALTGTTTDSIASSILKGFAEGKRSAADFANDFQGMLNNAVLQGVKMKALEEPLRQWYEQFAEASGSGLTADKIADLKAQYDKIITDAAKQLEDAEKITGITIGATEATRTAAASGIASMSQESASELNGNFYALILHADNISKDTASMSSLMARGLEFQERIARNTDRLEAIENEVRQTRIATQEMLNKGLFMRK